MPKLVYTDKSGREITETLGPDSPVVTVGRARDCTIRSNRKSVSRRHAEFHYKNGQCEVVDLDSSNGTYIIVDNRRKPVEKPEPLAHRDEIWCGDFILYFIDEQLEGAGVEPAVQSGNEQRPGSSRQSPASGGVSVGQEASPARSQPVSGEVGGAVSHGGPSDAPASPKGVGGGDSVGNEPSSIPGGPNNAGQAAGPAANNERHSPSSSGVSFGEPAATGSVDKLEDKVERLRDEKESLEALAERRNRRVDELEQKVQQLQNELSEARAGGADAEQVEELQREIEHRDRDLQILEKELEREVEAGQRLQDSLDEYETRIDELEAERDRLENEVETLRTERDDARTELQQAQGGDDERVEELQRQVEQLNRQLDEARAHGGEGADLSTDQTDRLAEHARTLDRIVDAIARTDLSPLSTVDRVRLESAIRDTQPRETLRQMLEIIGAED